MTRKHISIIISVFFAAIVFYASCAREVALTGGPKDIYPPEILYSEPDNATVNFNERRIRIFFDEYIRLNNLSQKLIISPPIDPKPDIFVRGKSIIINLDPEVLEENTTYSFNFNDAIADITENNALHSFIYAFSTGPYIDSLKVSGKVYDAYTRKPAKDAYVLLHSNLIDTAFRKLPPVYLVKVNEEGEFKIPFIKEGTYNIFALVDANFNFKFDLNDEEIAFLDTVITPSVIEIKHKHEKDSLLNDTIINKGQNYENNDNDTVPEAPQITYKYLPDDIKLFLFAEDHKSQYVVDRKREVREHIRIIFNRKQYNDFEFTVKGDDRALLIHSENPDTVNIWLRNEELIQKDTVFVYANYYSHLKPDSLISDTLRFTTRDLKKEQDTVLGIKVTARKHPARDMKINFDYPVLTFDKNKILLEKLVDTIYEERSFNLIYDSLNPMFLVVDSGFEEGGNYRFVFEEEFAESFYGLYNVVDTMNFMIVSSDEFGTLKISLDDKEGNFIGQLLKGEDIKYKAFSEEGDLKFLYVEPSTYKLKLIHDKNNNQRWDTGDLEKRIQPEPVMFFPMEIEIRANWNHEYDWELNRDNKQEVEK